jgi:CBS-domain-containing membrane protein
MLMSSGLRTFMYPTVNLSREQRKLHFMQTIPVLSNSQKKLFEQKLSDFQDKCVETYFQKLRGLLEAGGRRQLQTRIVTFGP